MSDETEDRTFEQWALAGACALALVGIAASLLGRDTPAPENAPAVDGASTVHNAGGDTGDLLRIRIGGERPDASLADPDPGRRAVFLVAPDPGPSPELDKSQQASAGDALVQTPLSPPRTVVVQRGETLSQIAQRELGTVKRLGEIIELNGIEDANHVPAGVTLQLPAR